MTADPGVRALTALALLLPLAVPAAAQEDPATQPATDWPHYAGDQGTQRYAPLPALTRNNFASLVFAWLYSSPDEGIPGAGSDELWAGKHESTPIMADGVLYNSTSFSQAYGRITAIDMQTGEHAWMTPVGRSYEQLPQFRGREMPPMGIPSRTYVVATSKLLLAAQEGVNLVTGTSPERNAARYQASPYLPALRAFDLDTGELIGEVALPGNATGALMAYQLDGKPYVVMPTGGAGLPAQLVALTLPSS